MRVEALAITLRSRQGWEAIDLGFRMATHWARPLWTAWLVVYVPLALACLLALSDEPLAAALLLWWLLPIGDRFALFVLSRRVFGDPASLGSTLAAWRTVLSPGLPRALLLRPFGWDRSFRQPIPVLERQAGAAASRRMALLGRRLGGHAMALALVCVCFELVIMVTLAVLDSLLTPAAEIGGAGATSSLADALGIGWWDWGVTLTFAIAAAIVEPFYVAAGFAMYLVRRTQLEGWDLELALRRSALAAAQASTLRATRPALLSCIGLALLLQMAAPPAASAASVPVSKQQLLRGMDRDEAPPEQRAQPPLDTEARRIALEVLADPEFGERRETMRWRLDIGNDRTQATSRDFDWLRTLGDWVAVGVRVMFWLLLAALAVAVVWLLLRYRSGRLPVSRAASAPAQLFGLAITPESLPDDVVAAALAAIDRGELREAVSLLYRGALSYLVNDCAMRIGDGATEGEVLRIAAPLLTTADDAHFRQLVAAWIDIAYGHREADPQHLRTLCIAQRRHFARGPAVDLQPAAPGATA